MKGKQQKNILVTGASGFLGDYILNVLLSNQDYNITGLGFNNVREKKGVNMQSCNLNDMIGLEKFVQDADVIIHAAGFVSFDSSDYKTLMKVNGEGTENIVNLALESSVSHFVHVSSIAAFPNSEDDKVIKEDNRFKDRNFTSEYGVSKYIGESHVWRAYAEGLNVSIVNPSLILGEGDWKKGTASFFPTFKSGLKYFPTGSTGVVYADDVAKFIALIIEEQPEAVQFILSSENISYEKLFSWIAKSVGQKPPHIAIKGFYKWAAFLIDKINKYLRGKYSYLSRQNLKNISSHKRYDNTLSLGVSGFSYTPIDGAIELIGDAYLQSLA